MSVPQLPHCTGSVWPGAQTPWHVPPTQVCPVHGVAAPHVPATHDCELLPEHCVCPVVHAPWHTPPTHVPLVHAVAVPQSPQGSHVCTSDPEHCVSAGVQTGLSGQEHGPQVHDARHDSVP